MAGSAYCCKGAVGAVAVGVGVGGVGVGGVGVGGVGVGGVGVVGVGVRAVAAAAGTGSANPPKMRTSGITGNRSSHFASQVASAASQGSTTSMYSPSSAAVLSTTTV